MFEVLLQGVTSLASQTIVVVRKYVESSEISLVEVRQSARYMYFVCELHVSREARDDAATPLRIALRITKGTGKVSLVNPDYDPRIEKGGSK